MYEYVQRNIKARQLKHCCRRKNMFCTYSECVCVCVCVCVCAALVMQHAQRMCRNILSHVA
jgi:hypothetical protein